MSGWIKIHRKFLDWEWKKNPNMVALFLHVLLKANYEDGEWKGNPIKRGQLPTGRKALAQETGLSEQQVRTSLINLQKAGALTIKTTKQFSLLTIVKYNEYQSRNEEPTNKPTNNQPTNPQQSTTLKEDKNKEIKEERSYSGKVVKLNAEDFERKKNLCPSLSEKQYLNELQKADEWYGVHGDKNWFFKINTWLEKAEQYYLENNKKAKTEQQKKADREFTRKQKEEIARMTGHVG